MTSEGVLLLLVVEVFGRVDGRGVATDRPLLIGSDDRKIRIRQITFLQLQLESSSYQNQI